MRPRSVGILTALLLGMAMSTAETHSQEAGAEFWQALLVDDSLTAEQRRKVSAAFELLTPLHQAILRRHLRWISFSAELPNNAWTMRLEPAGIELEFGLVINVRVLDETLSELMTRKERQLFEAEGSPLTVTISAGSMDALGFVLLHEATHMVDMAAVRFTPPSGPEGQVQEARQTPFASGIWETVITPVGAYRGEMLDSIFWRTGKPLDIENARALYEELERTPFASVYASRSTAEDIAELVAWWQMTEVHGQPYRIEVRDEGELVYAYEPMKSSLVRSRLNQLDRFDSAEQ